MKSRITIIGPDVKSILSLYDDDMPVTDVTLGDTCHPSSGYVNEDLIRGVKTVSALLAFDYDFPCLVEFSATIGATVVKLVEESNGQSKYNVVGPKKMIRKMIDALVTKIAVGHEYQYEVQW